MDFNLREKAEIVSLAQQVNESLDSKPLTKWYADKMQKGVVENIYANIREEIVYIIEETGESTPETVKDYITQDKFNGNPIVPLDVQEIDNNCGMISLQLQLLDRSNIVDSLRNETFEKEARTWLLEETWPEGEGFGTSDYSYAVTQCLSEYGIKFKVENGRYVREDGWEPEDTDDDRHERLRRMQEMFAPIED